MLANLGVLDWWKCDECDPERDSVKCREVEISVREEKGRLSPFSPRATFFLKCDKKTRSNDDD